MRRAFEISLAAVLWCLLATTVTTTLWGLGPASALRVLGTSPVLERAGYELSPWVLLGPLPLACGLLWALPARGWRRAYRSLFLFALGVGVFLAAAGFFVPFAWPLALAVVILKQREVARDADALNRADPPSPAGPASGSRSAAPDPQRP